MDATFSPSAILDRLEPEQIVERLAALDREAQALRVLLRAVRARQRAGIQRGNDRRGESRGGKR
jgi:hypothetical protein